MRSHIHSASRSLRRIAARSQERRGAAAPTKRRNWCRAIVISVVGTWTISMNASAKEDNFGDELPEHARVRCGTIRLRHGDVVSGVSFFPDGCRLATSSWDATVSIWDCGTGRELARLGNPDEMLRAFCVDVSPDGTLVAAGGLDNSIRLWRVSDGREISTLKGHSWYVLGVAFSPNGKLLASCAFDDTIRLWSVAAGKCLAVLRGHERAVTAIRFSPNSDLVASASKDMTVRLWDVKRRSEVRRFTRHKDRAMAVAFSHDGRLLASGTGDSDAVVEESAVRVWDVKSGRLAMSIFCGDGGVAAVAFSPDDTTLAVAAGKSIRLVDVTSGIERAQREVGNWTTSVVFDAAGRLVAYGSHNCAVGLLIPPTIKDALPFDAPADGICHMAVSPDGKLIATADGNCWTRILDCATGKTVAKRRWRTNVVSGIHFADAKSTVAVATGARKTAYVELWQFTKDQVVGRLGSYKGLVCTAGNADRGILALAAVGAVEYDAPAESVELWSVPTLRRLDTLPVRCGYTMEFGELGKKRMLAAFSQERLQVWDFDEGRMTIDAEGAYSNNDSCAFAACGFLITGSASIHGQLEWWDLRKPTGPQRLLDLEQPVVRLSCSSDGRIVAAGCVDGYVHLVRVSDGARKASFRAHRDVVSGLAFLRGSNNLLASAGSDATAMLWDINGFLPKD